MPSTINDMNASANSTGENPKNMGAALLSNLLGQALGGGQGKEVEAIKQEKDYTDVMLIGLLVVFLLAAGVGVYILSVKKG